VKTQPCKQKQTYNKNLRKSLLDFLSLHPDRQFTADELCRAVNGSCERARSSVYRHISTLCRDGILQKFRNDTATANVYQYVGERCDCSSHFHEKCLRCGNLRHIDCNDSLEFARHLLTEHGFSVNCGQSILYGICAACREKGDATK